MNSDVWVGVFLLIWGWGQGLVMFRGAKGSLLAVLGELRSAARRISALPLYDLSWARVLATVGFSQELLDQSAVKIRQHSIYVSRRKTLLLKTDMIEQLGVHFT